MHNDGLASERTILWSWTSIGELAHQVARHRETLLIEQVGPRGFAIGPAFGTTASVCLDCYLGRRRANGAAECRPVAAPDDVLGSPQACRLIANFLTHPGDLGATQSVVSDHGVETHAVFSLPGCTRCHAGDGARDGGRERCDPWRLEAAVSPRLGLVHNVEMRDIGGGFSLASAIGCRTDAFRDVRALAYGHAADRDPRRARGRAIAEALERYAAAICDPARLLELGDPAVTRAISVPPDRVRVVGEWAPERWRWVAGRSVASGDAWFVPACLVFLPYAYLGGEPPLTAQSSSGLAIAWSREAAVRHALLELVERDALMRAWQADIRFEICSERALADGTLYTCRVPCSWSASVALALLERGEAPYCSAGIAARADLADAMAAAEAEAIGVFGYLHERFGNADGARGKRELPAGNMFRHALDPRLRETRRRRMGARSSPDAAPRFSAAALREELGEAVCVDLASSDLSMIGLHAVRVVAPSLIPIDIAGLGTAGLAPLPVG